MAYNGALSSATPPVAPLVESRQYTPYRPSGQQQQQQQVGHHPLASHGFQHPQQPQHVSQHNYQPLPSHQAGDLPPAMAAMTIDGVTPAPLRLQRKPVAGPGMSSEGPPVAQTQQPQSPPPTHPQSGYFSMPTPAPSPYVANVQSHPPLQQQQYGSYYPPQFPASPPPQQWHGGPAYATPSQATPPTVYEMESPPSSSSYQAFPVGGVAPSIPPKVFQPVQTFIAELEGSEPPGHSDGQNTSAKDPPATPVPNPEPSLAEDSEVTQAVESDPLADSTSDPPSKSPEAEPQQVPDQDAPSNPVLTLADSEGLMVVEKPPPPDHEGLILSDGAPGSIADSSHSGHTHQSAQQPISTSPYPGPIANMVHQWPWHPSLNGPNPQHVAPLDQSSPSPASPAASLHLQQGTPASHPTPPPYPLPATATPPPAPLASPTAGNPISRPHSTTFSTAQSHSPSPSLQGSQAGAAATTSPPPPTPQQASHVPAAPSYTPAAFPSKPSTFPIPPTPSGHGTVPASHPSAIPSTPSIAGSQHSFSAPPQQPASKSARHSGASTSFGGFANSVFSKDTVKWSKKTASRFGGAIKTAATSAHAAATSAQTAASQAAALHRQKSFAAAQMKASSGNQGGVNPQPTTTAAGVQSQPPSNTTGMPAPTAAPSPQVYGPQGTAPAPMGINATPGGVGYTAPQGQGPPVWPSGIAAGVNMGNPRMPAAAGVGPQPGAPPPPFQRSNLGTVSGYYPQPLAGQPPYPNQQQQQSWLPGAPITGPPGNVVNVPPVPGAATTPGGPTAQPSPPPAQMGLSAQTYPQGPGASYQHSPPVILPSGTQETPPAQPQNTNTQIQDPQPEPSEDDAATKTEATPDPPVPNDKTETEPQTENSPRLSSEVPAPDTSDGVGRQTPKPDTSHQHNESAGTASTASLTPGQATEGQSAHSGQPQPQPQPSDPAASPPHSTQGQPPPSAVHPSPGYHQGSGGGPVYPYTYGQHSQPQPSGYANPPGPSPATPAPGGMSQPGGGQPPQQYPYPANVPTQQHTWNPGSPPPQQTTWGPPAAPVAGQGPPGQPTYAQQPWGQAPVQSWAPPYNGAPAYGPNQNYPTQPAIALPQPQYATPQPPTQYGMSPPPQQPQAPGQQPAPWPAPNVAPYSAPVPNPAATNWQQQQQPQQPPPQWHTPAPQQPAWGPPPGPMQSAPSPYPQPNNSYPQPAGAWDPNAQQPQPWPQPQQPWSHPQ